jgi:hypothetical protein
MTGRAFTLEEIQSAHFTSEPAFAGNRKAKKGRKAEGIRYEKKAQEHLCALSDYYLPSPWIIFIANGKPHWCQPDGIHFDFNRGVLTIIEVKYSHTAEAQRQLRHVYAPVLRRMFPAALWTIRLVELVKWYDPDIKFPEKTVMCPDPFAHQLHAIGVHIWRP